jgi:hypothetical protein
VCIGSANASAYKIEDVIEREIEDVIVRGHSGFPVVCRLVLLHCKHHLLESRSRSRGQCLQEGLFVIGGHADLSGFRCRRPVLGVA